METMALHDFHSNRNAQFGVENTAEAVSHYGDVRAEYTALNDVVGAIDFSFRSRLCVLGSDRARFLHGQVTNEIKRLRESQGCYAALVSAKGKMESDLNVFCLRDEILLDFEPGLATAVAQRLEKYIVADDVQVVDVAPHYGLWSIQGPSAEEVVRRLGLFPEVPGAAFQSVYVSDPELGQLYLMHNPRLGRPGFDLFIPTGSLRPATQKLVEIVEAAGGRPCGLEAFEIMRIEAGIPRFGVDMDQSHLPQECGIEDRAISYNKGCYIGQEILNRIHSIGHVNRHLCGLRLEGSQSTRPSKGDKVFLEDREAGHVTSAVFSPSLQAPIALGYVRREMASPGTRLILRSAEGQCVASIVELPFRR